MAFRFIPYLDIPSVSADFEKLLVERGAKYKKHIIRDGGSVGYSLEDGEVEFQTHTNPDKKGIRVQMNVDSDTESESNRVLDGLYERYKDSAAKPKIVGLSDLF